MEPTIVTKLLFTVTFPNEHRSIHVPPMKLHSLAKQQLTDGEVIDTIDHLFGCRHCFEQYRFIRTAYQASA